MRHCHGKTDLTWAENYSALGLGCPESNIGNTRQLKDLVDSSANENHYRASVNKVWKNVFACPEAFGSYFAIEVFLSSPLLDSHPDISPSDLNIEWVFLFGLPDQRCLDNLVLTFVLKKLFSDLNVRGKNSVFSSKRWFNHFLFLFIFSSW